MDVSIVETSGLGDRSYLISEGDTAGVIDPQRDIDRVLASRAGRTSTTSAARSVTGRSSRPARFGCALHTPGHTHHHMSYELIDGESGTVAVITGGSLLHGSTGRTDLLGAEHTEELTHAQFHSARRLATELPANTTIYPTHGFGWRYTWGAPLTLIGDDATVLTA